MARTAVTAPAFTVLSLSAGERTLIGVAGVSSGARLQRDALAQGDRLLSSGT
jgi:hypothetical protein